MNQSRLSEENQEVINKFYKYKLINDLFQNINDQNQKLDSNREMTTKDAKFDVD